MIVRSRRRSAVRLVIGLGIAGALVATALPAVSAAGPTCSVGNGPEKYSDLQAAIDRAAARAKLVVSGTCQPRAGGSFYITRSLTLIGDGAALEGVATPTDFGTKLHPVLTIVPGTVVNVSGFTITGGEVGIQNAGTLTVSNVAVGGNAAGGIANSGSLDVMATTVTGGEGGPGIHNTGTGSVADSIVSDNHSMTEGGGIWNGGTLTLTRSTVTANSSAYHGGGIFNSGALTLVDTTVTGNSAQFGGGIWNGFIADVCIAPEMTVTGNAPNQVIGNYVIRSACP